MCLGEPCVQQKKDQPKQSYYDVKRDESYSYFKDGKVSSHRVEDGLYRLREYFNHDGTLETRTAKFLDPELGSLKEKMSGRQLELNTDGYVASATYGYQIEFNNPTQFDNYWLKQSQSLYGQPQPAVTANDDYIAILYGYKEDQYSDYGIRLGITNLEKLTCSVGALTEQVYGRVGDKNITFNSECFRKGNKIALVYKPASKSDANLLMDAIVMPIAHSKVVIGAKLDYLYVEVDGKKIPFDTSGFDQYLIKNSGQNVSPFKLF
ncbi:hypothetical protein VroAM7_30160 [Vibrio rotiferianus]|uniref:Uncharacterized protein n=2 Tax=Vibrio rotiferianus TaxID=190895 RepID=A0A510I9F4_9VIBR|nr:hypothetical protein VroAM7_30160 [Vibrio rotiferianus]